MSSHNKIGADGENLADEWLKKRGYEILHRNWRHSHYEIDIIATKNNWLHIVEVKCRNASPFGYPEDSVTKKKFKHLQRAADQFIF
jgi:putative endonuclease